MGLTLVEKIATRYAVGLGKDGVALQGQIVRIRPKHVMTHDNTGAVIPKFVGMFGDAAPKVADPHQPVFAIDHDIQNHSPENLAKYAKIGKFAATHSIDFYPAGTGISHQVMVEQGYVTPGSMVVGSDSHSNFYGAVGALGTPVVRTDAACIWATGSTWWQVPKVARCKLLGELPAGVVGKDVIIALCGLFNQDQVLNHAIEFVGEGVASMSMDQRMSISNMTTEWGALAGLFPFDDVLRRSLEQRADYFANAPRPGTRSEGSRGGYTRDDIAQWWDDRLEPDAGAHYAVEIELDLATVTPHVSGPNEVKTMTSLPEITRQNVAIQKAYLLSCVNARLEDFAAAAAVVRGKKVAAGVEFYIAAASATVQQQAQELGHWGALIDAGAIALPPGCGPCIGLGQGTTQAGEVAISATNRNFKGRMGSADSLVYLGSPAVVAASAIAGHICAPTPFDDTSIRCTLTTNTAQTDTSAATTGAQIIDGFPQKITGRALYLPKDNMNTDGIFAGKWTYKDDLTRDQMKNVTFENYDIKFNEVYKPGDVIVSGNNFGTGSSREQAATALKYKGVPCVIAASFSETYRRNAFNNGFLCLECPGLVDHLAEAFSDSEQLTIQGPEIEVDFTQSVVRADGQTFAFPPLSSVAQELVVAGGAEAAVQNQLA